MGAKTSWFRRVIQTLGSVRTGILLLISVVIISAVGTVILQRPVTDPDTLQRAYSPQTLQWLDRLGMTDIFHAWWFATLLVLLSLSIVLASLERFPQAWRKLTRPHKFPEAHFRGALPLQARIPVGNAEAGLRAADSAFRRAHLKPERIRTDQQVSLYAERNRLSIFSVYIVHTSLLLIFLGGIVDAVWGYKGYLMLTRGQQASVLELRDGTKRALPFTLRCDGAGQENYPDGSPKKWWSKLAVVENGQEVERKEIVVNDPLVRDGIRFYQSGFGSSGELDTLSLVAVPKAAGAKPTEITLSADAAAPVDADTTVKMVKFIPDAYVRDGEVYSRSKNAVNPVAQLEVTSAKTGKTVKVWASTDPVPQEDSPYAFKISDLQMGYFTGLQVSHEPGQWAVWTGCLLMALGLGLAFYCVHQRFWAVVVEDAKGGQVLWLGTAADKNREHFEAHFREMVERAREELQKEPAAPARKPKQEEHALAEA